VAASSLTPQFALQRYQRLLEVNRLITSSLDRETILPVVVERAASLLGGEAAVLLLLDHREGSERLRVAAAHNVPAARTAGLLLSLDTDTMPAIRELYPGSEPGAFVAVPMLLRDETVGVLAVYCRAEYHATPEDEQLLAGLADQAVIAIENARLYQQANRAQYLQEVLTSIPDPVYVTDETGRVVLVNQAGLDLLGVTTREELSRPLPDWTPSYDVRDGAGQALKPEEMPIGRALKGETFAGIEARLRNLREGSDLWTLVSGAPLRDESGRVTGCVVAAKDITETRRAEAERERLLAEAQRRVVEQDTIFFALADGVIVYDEHGIPVKANRAAIEALGFDPTDADHQAAIPGVAYRALNGRPLPLEEMPRSRALRGETVVGKRLIFTGAAGQDVHVLASAAPLVVDGRIVGAIGAFTDVTELRQRNVVLRAVQMASASLELNQVLRSVAEAMVADIGVSHCGIYLPELGADALVLRAVAGDLAEERQDALRGRHLDPGSEAIFRDVLRQQVSATAHGEEIRSRLSPETLQALGAKSILAVPIRIGGRVLGIALLSNLDSERAFTDEEALLADGIASAVALAIDNARLYEETHRRLTEIQSLQAVVTALLQRLKLEDILNIVCREAQQLTEARGASVLLLEEKPNWLRVAGCTGAVRPSVGRLPIEGSFAGGAIQRGEALLTNDPHYESQEPDDHWNANLTNLLAAPLQREGTVIGVLVVANRPGGFTADNLRIVSLLADRAAIAVESARLYQREEQLAVLEERQRIARDLHDSVAQSLYSVVLYAETAVRSLQAGDQTTATDHLREVRKISQESLREMRLLIFELRPPVLDKVGLEAALQARLELVEERAGLQAELRVEGEGSLPSAVQEELYHIAQEALNNVLKHAWARKVSVLVRMDGPTALLEVADDGLGFDWEGAQQKQGFGLRGMAERAERIGGNLEIESVPGKGTRVNVTVDTTELTT
jgi:PAS domain S-box-containing protein